MKLVATAAGKTLAAAFFYLFVSAIIGGAVIGIGWPFPQMTKTISPIASMAGLALGALVVAGFLIPLVRGTSGSVGSRIFLFAGFLILTSSINGAIEGLIFTTILRREHLPALLTQGIFAWSAMAVLLAVLWSHEGSPVTAPLSRTWWRLALAWLAWPFTYYLFGMMVAPIVINSYLGGVPGLRIPSPDVILFTQLGRSVIFLAATVPFLLRWTGSRTGLVVALGLAHWASVGLFGLLPPSDFGPMLRIVHSIEIGLDSFVYSWLLVTLLQPKAKAASRPLAVAA